MSKNKKKPLRKNSKIKTQIRSLQEAVHNMNNGPKLTGGKPVSLSKAERLTEQIFQPPLKD